MNKMNLVSFRIACAAAVDMNGLYDNEKDSCLDRAWKEYQDGKSMEDVMKFFKKYVADQKETHKFVDICAERFVYDLIPDEDIDDILYDTWVIVNSTKMPYEEGAKIFEMKAFSYLLECTDIKYNLEVEANDYKWRVGEDLVKESK